MYDLAFLLAATAVGGWGSAGCGPVGPPVSASAVYEWRTFSGDPDRSYLFRNGVQIAGYDHRKDIYRAYDAATGQWSAPAKPPWATRQEAGGAARPSSQPTGFIGSSASGCGCSSGCQCQKACPCPDNGPCCSACLCALQRKSASNDSTNEPQPSHDPAAAREPIPNFGVDVEKLNGGKQESYKINGRSASAREARQAIAGSQIPDDSAKLRLTIIGNEADRKRVLNDLAAAPALAELKDRCLVQAYPPDHWAVARAGFVATGKPTIYLQHPNGRVLHRQDDYSGPADLATAIRRADPHYDPKKDPDLRKWSILSDLQLLKVPMAVWLLGAGGLCVLLRRAVHTDASHTSVGPPRVGK